MRSVFIQGSIILVAVVITTLGIRASDTIEGISASLLGQTVGTVANTECPAGMTTVTMVESITCVDTYEASVGATCPLQTITSEEDTRRNLAQPTCQAVSESGAMPWVYVHREEARTLCARAGKRLPTASEWYRIALGTPADSCVIDSTSANPAGSAAACVSALGVHDAVGNVWEWQSADVVNGNYNGQELPPEGYVQGVTAAGLPIKTTETASSTAYGLDFFWMEETGTYGMLRGGFYGSGSDAGVYTTHAKTASEITTPAIGFRCVL